MKKIFILAILLIANYNSFSQFLVDAQLRPRGEIRNGYKNIAESSDIPAFLISQRTRFGLTFTQDLYKIRINIQDVRIWGDESLYSSTAVYGDNASLDLYEGWLLVRLGSSFTAKIGRQEWYYEDQRLLSRRNWNQNGVVYDGILLGFNKKNIQLDLGLSMNNDKDNTSGNEYTPDKLKFLNFIYFNGKISDALNASFMGVLSGNQKEEGSNTIYVLGTLGPYIKYKSTKLSAQFNAFYQTGTNIKSETVSAYLLNAKANLQINQKIIIGAGFDIISGNDKSKIKTKDNSFDLLYGGRHSFNGEMDLFSNLQKSTSDAGLNDYYANLGLKINHKNSVFLTYHNFRLNTNAYKPDTMQELNKQLSSEIDFSYKHKHDLPIDLTIGFCINKPTKSMKIIQNISETDNTFNYFSYIMFTLTPELFSTK
ncbi:MAG: alginate export family protein [Bacteroidales bacterium]